ncbi:MAG: polysaccharide deacetylase family protein, partial [Acidobacteriota bacterium]|nr:polysaccharide deacetylase family protein [Acidobacteriota bacterium]
MMKGKRDLLSKLASYTGFLRVLDLLPTKPQLLVLNYHRIGNPEETLYDAQVFSTSAETLNEQVRYLKRRVELINLEEAIEIAEKRTPLRHTRVLLTFDDGYRDNYDLAFPILRSHGVQGVFFLPTQFIGTSLIPWWDEIAYLIQQANTGTIHLPGSPERTFELSHSNRRPVIEAALALYKSLPASSGELFLDDLAAQCHVERCSAKDRLFATWEEIAEMVRGGMAIGSHTHTHQILSRTSEQEQTDELSLSKRILEERLGGSITSLAYPVGLPDSFSVTTRTIAKNMHYRVAFSFHGGFNREGAIDPFNIRRHGIHNPTR